MLGVFHTAKCVEHCIGNYIRGSGIEESLMHRYLVLMLLILFKTEQITRVQWKAALFYPVQ